MEAIRKGSVVHIKECGLFGGVLEDKGNGYYRVGLPMVGAECILPATRLSPVASREREACSRRIRAINGMAEAYITVLENRL